MDFWPYVSISSRHPSKVVADSREVIDSSKNDADRYVFTHLFNLLSSNNVTYEGTLNQFEPSPRPLRSCI